MKRVPSFFIRFYLISGLLYLAIFIVYTFPALLRFNTHLFADTGDGFQHVWNIWWVNQAVTKLQVTPWSTHYLHYPYGTSLLGHTLNPTNGVLAIVLLRAFNLIQTYNLLVIFAFVASGIFAYQLAYYITKSHAGSLIAGFVYTFSNYHFAHAEGHLELISIQWLPLFLLTWLMFLQRPNVLRATVAGLCLYLITLTSFYYFFYGIVAAFIIMLWHVSHKGFIWAWQSRIGLACFIFVSLITTGRLLISFGFSYSHDPFSGGHVVTKFSTDLLAPIIPGGHSRFAHLTSAYWTKLPGNIHESSVYVGLIPLIIAVFTALKYRRTLVVQIWSVLGILFLILSWGSVLHFWGLSISRFTPYALLEKVFPPIRLSGVPLRMMVMVMLSLAVLNAFGFQQLFNSGKRRLAIGLLIIMLIEFLPRPLTLTLISIPEYVQVLQHLPAGAVLDTSASEYENMFYQTIHNRPIAFGFLSRTPRSVQEKDQILHKMITNGQYDKLCQDYQFRYLVIQGALKMAGWPQLLYQKADLHLYDLQPC